jgi:hypothetical protein
MPLHGLKGQSFSALGAAAVENTASLFCGHAFAKAVSSGPLKTAWLICAFHCDLRFGNMPFLFSKSNMLFCGRQAGRKLFCAGQALGAYL